MHFAASSSCAFYFLFDKSVVSGGSKMKKTAENKASTSKFGEIRLCVGPPNPNKSKETKIAELPSFNGNDVVGWCAKAEDYFELDSTPSHLKVSLAMACMEGFALHWFRFVRKCSAELTWESFKSALLKRYGGDDSGRAESSDGRAAMKRIEGFERLFAVKQTGSVDEYIDDFVMQAVEIPSLTNEQYLGIFLNGLKEDLRVRIKLNDSQDILETMVIARVIERKLLKTDGMLQGGREKGSDRPSLLEEVRDASKLASVMYLNLMELSGTRSNAFKGVMTGRHVSILISGTASHNFISNDVVNKFKLQVQPTENFGVRLVNGRVYKSLGVCKDLKIEVCCFEFVADFYAFPLVEGVDVVLSTEWLQELEYFGVLFSLLGLV